MANNDLQYVKKVLPNKVLNIGLAILAVGLIVGAFGLILDPVRAKFSYLLGFFFILTIGMGSLFLIALEYVVNADWSTPMRRVPEFFASTVPLFLLIAVPLFFFMHDLFHWSHTEAVESDKLLKGKEPYLNIQFFIIRVVVTFAIWSIYYFFVVRNSRKQDETKDQKLTKKNIVASAIFIPLFAITDDESRATLVFDHLRCVCLLRNHACRTCSNNPCCDPFEGKRLHASKTDG